MKWNDDIVNNLTEGMEGVGMRVVDDRLEVRFVETESSCRFTLPLNLIVV